jgi:hypothetical protein
MKYVYLIAVLCLANSFSLQGAVEKYARLQDDPLVMAHWRAEIDYLERIGSAENFLQTAQNIENRSDEVMVKAGYKKLPEELQTEVRHTLWERTDEKGNRTIRKKSSPVYRAKFIIPFHNNGLEIPYQFQRQRSPYSAENGQPFARPETKAFLDRLYKKDNMSKVLAESQKTSCVVQ